VNIGFRELRKEVHWCFIVFPEERIKVNIATLQYLLVVFYPGNEQFSVGHASFHRSESWAGKILMQRMTARTMLLKQMFTCSIENLPLCFDIIVNY